MTPYDGSVLSRRAGVTNSMPVAPSFIGTTPSQRAARVNGLRFGNMHATHTGDGLGGVKPTGKRVSAEQMHFVRFQDGKIVEHWAVRDDAGLLRQLGS